ncbi:MAG: PilZ domain-containing protein [Brevinematia bacterium]
MAGKVILDYGEIISVLKICKMYSIRFIVYYDNNKVSGLLHDLSEYTLTLKVDFEIPPTVKAVDVSFEFSKEPYHFKGDVIKIFGKDVTLLVPSQLEVWVPRKYERSFCYGKVFANINIIRDLPSSLRDRIPSLPSQLALIYKELTKDSPNTALIMKMVDDELKRNFEISEISLHKQGQSLPLAVLIIVKYKKSLLIEDTLSQESYFKRYLADEVISISNFMTDLGWSIEKMNEEVKKFINHFSNSDIKSVAYVPMSLFENVVGHIRVATSISKLGKVITLRDVFYIKSLADIVSESIAKYKLFSLSNQEEFPLAVHDISVGGAKIEIEQYLAKFLEVGNKLKVNLKFYDGKRISVKGKVIRIDVEDSKLFLAVEFVDLDKVDESILSSFVENNKR